MLAYWRLCARSGYSRAATRRALATKSATRARQQHVVRRDAGLPGVDRLAEQDALDRRLEARARADDGRRLAAELQRHRRQVGRGRAHHLVADRGGAGEQQVVERQRGERLRHRRVAGDHLHLVVAEVLRGLFGEQRREARRVLAHLDHHAVAGGQRIHQRAHREIERVVPRHHDADHAARLRQQRGARGQEQPVGQRAPRLHPAAAVAQRVAHRGQAGEDFQQVGLFRRAPAEVGIDGHGEGLALLAQHRLERAQATRAHAPVGQRFTRLGTAQVGKGGVEVGAHQNFARSSTPHMRGGVMLA
jgi:hypothetical protein